MSHVLALPHSNGNSERVFALVQNTCTEARSTMTNATFESILIQKVTTAHDGPYHSHQVVCEIL
jgi:hypothetical protein